MDLAARLSGVLRLAFLPAIALVLSACGPSEQQRVESVYALASGNPAGARAEIVKQWNARTISLDACINLGHERLEHARAGAPAFALAVLGAAQDLESAADKAGVTEFYVSVQDYFDFLAFHGAGGNAGRGYLSNEGLRKGYAGYEHDQSGLLSRFCHVRHRVYDTRLGRWIRRDPVGYVDGPNLYESMRSQPITAQDPSGLIACASGDTVKVRCKSIVGGLARHCVVRCCGCSVLGQSGQPVPGERGGCNVYGLNPGPDGNVNRTPNQPFDWGFEDDDWCEAQEYRGVGLCQRLLDIVEENNRNAPWPYNPGNCNSNWYAGSLLACATGNQPGAGCPGSSGWGIDHCTIHPRAHVKNRFVCSPDMPGHGLPFTRPEPESEWLFAAWYPADLFVSTSVLQKDIRRLR